MTAPPDLAALMAAAVAHHQAGRLAEAERLYRQVLAADPRNPFALHLLGIIAHQAGRGDIAVDLIAQAIAQDGQVAAFHNSLGNALMGQGRFAEAASAYGRALALQPELAEAHCNLGGALASQGRLDDATASYRRALSLKPDYAKAHASLGDALAAQGRPEDAAASYQRALGLAPKDAGVHNNLGNALKAAGRVEEAVASYRQALALAPGLAEAHRNLGNALMEQGQPAEAEAAYVRALAANPRYAEAQASLGTALAAQGRLEEAAECWRRALTLKPDLELAGRNLALLLSDTGRHADAIAVIRQILQQSETAEAKRVFVACAKNAGAIADDSQYRALMARALREAWGRPSDLAGSAAALVMAGRDATAFVERAMTATPGDLLAAPEFARLAADPLLQALLVSVPVCDARLERALTLLRRAALELAEANSGALPQPEFFGVLAQQCFLDDYVFGLVDGELQRAKALGEKLTAALEAGAPVSASSVLAVAAYLPLGSLRGSARLLGMNWPGTVQHVLTQQVAEPAQEAAEQIPRLTVIDDETSRAVRDQYEEGPFPRWVRLPPAAMPKSLARFLSDKFPLAAFRRPAAGSIAVLVAGCGTGQHAIETAQQFDKARVTAIDLSRNSLAYARRKTGEMGIAIDYAQADLLKLEAGPFDVIEAVGVLHHLADPWAGWRKLLTLLRSGGFMHVALYSELGRHQVVELRRRIADGGTRAAPDDIRRFRQDLLAGDGDFRKTTESVDFNSLSMCRDLLFHVQEQRLTLDTIAAFLVENDLAFLGFELDLGTLASYRRHYPGDPAATDLGQWRAFEERNPDTFSGMYNFWVQKPG